MLLQIINKSFMETNIIQDLGKCLDEIIGKAKEMYIAVALANEYSIEVLKGAPKTCKIKIVVGVNLPTPVSVLKDLRALYKNNARIYRGEFFHPKVYLFKLIDNNFVCFISSGNFTEGGLSSNIELSYKTTNEQDCLQVLSWFDDVFKGSEIITDSFLNEYKEYAAAWHDFKKGQRKALKQIDEHQDQIKNDLLALKKILQRKRNEPEYKDICATSKSVIESVRQSVDYYNGFKNIDIDAFLKIEQLGRIIPTYIQSLKKSAKNGKMKQLFSMLCDDGLSIEERYRRACTVNKLNGCGKNVITKIMVIHDPKKYLLWNAVVDEYMKRFEITFERGTKEWTKYSNLCDIFNSLCNEVDIEDFAILDEMLYRAMDEFES